jgi:hypothetical protein
VVVLALASLPVVGHAQEARSSTGPTFESFRIVVDRNIFDPNRRPSQPGQLFAPEKSPPPDQLALVGALVNDEGAVAFFEGSKAEYSVDVKLGETIAGLRVAEIRTDWLTLENEDRQIELPVGSGLSKIGEGEWELSSVDLTSNMLDLTSSSSAEDGTDASSTQTPFNAESASGSSSDLLEKLRERRRQELGQ